MIFDEVIQGAACSRQISGTVLTTIDQVGLGTPVTGLLGTCVRAGGDMLNTYVNTSETREIANTIISENWKRFWIFEFCRKLSNRFGL